MYQLHRPDPAVPFEDSVGALVDLQKDGKIGHVGLSNVSVQQLRDAQRLTPVVSVQNRYNLGDRGSDAVLKVCEDEALAFLPWAPIQDVGARPVVREIADRHGATVQQVVLAWLLARSPQMLPIPGTSSVAHLEENIAAAALQLTADDVMSLTNGA